VTCWGANGSGQVTGFTTSARVPDPAATPVSALATAVVAGASHTCALVAGAVKCWGANGLGQRGGATDVTGAATPIPSNATALAAGANHTCAVVAGAVKCWGDDTSGQLGGAPAAGTATPIAAGILLVAASSNQTCASTGVSNGLGLDDVVQCWGSGLGATFLPGDPQSTPAVPLKQPGQSTIRADVSLLAVGRAHVCVEQKTEAVQCFGPDDALGQLGGTPAGPTESVAVPVPVTVPAAVALAAGADHTCVALGDGRLRCWGANDRGQLGGDPSPNPIVVPSGR